jgi:DNA-binding GntR family transcriptional regulator
VPDIVDRAGTPSGSALVDALAARIREKILSGDLPIGAQLRQADLAAEFGVSRMPVREALRQLQNGGLITVAPNRGAVVRVPAPWEVREAYEVRAELEALAARRAVRRITPAVVAELRALNDQMRERASAATARADLEPAHRHRGSETFHNLIASCAQNGRLTRVITDLHEAFPRNILAQLLVDDPRYCAENFSEHDAIVDALEKADGEAAGALMHDHVVHAGEYLARWFEQRSSTVFRG